MAFYSKPSTDSYMDTSSDESNKDYPNRHSSSSDDSVESEVSVEWDSSHYFACGNCIESKPYQNKHPLAKGEDFEQHIDSSDGTSYYQFSDSYNTTVGSVTTLEVMSGHKKSETTHFITTTHDGKVVKCNKCRESVGWLCTKSNQEEGFDDGVKEEHILLEAEKLVKYSVKHTKSEKK